jgi:hypothetical protein
MEICPEFITLFFYMPSIFKADKAIMLPDRNAKADGGKISRTENSATVPLNDLQTVREIYHVIGLNYRGLHPVARNINCKL